MCCNEEFWCYICVVMKSLGVTFVDINVNVKSFGVTFIDISVNVKSFSVISVL